MFGFNSLVPYGRNQKQDILDGFFNDSFFPSFFASEMNTDIKETETEYQLNVDIPGASKDNIAIDYSQNDVLSVFVNRREDKEEKKGGYLRKERREGRSSREFYLPGVVSDQISAKYENGVLSITLPKGSEKQQRKIEIQ